MAAIDLTTLNWNNGGANKKIASVTTTNQEVIIPKWAKLVTVQAVSQAIYFSYIGTDGASPVADAFPQAVSSIIQYNPVQTTSNRSIYLASQSGTATIYLIFE
jgi:hypothetical protein|tara:strand:+ start:393 stop:701 length:309 start_codon:yes stop_codon:yes gene_type:complete